MKKLSRVELLELMISLSEDYEELVDENNKLKKMLSVQRLPRSTKVGSIAEAALQANGYFESAQRSADAYLREIKHLRDELAKRVETRDRDAANARAAAAQQADRQMQLSLQQAQAQANQLVARANAQAEAIVANARAQAEETLANANRQSHAMIAQAQRQASSYQASSYQGSPYQGATGSGYGSPYQGQANQAPSYQGSAYAGSEQARRSIQSVPSPAYSSYDPAANSATAELSRPGHSSHSALGGRI